MELKNITVGKRVAYTVKGKSGKGRVVKIRDTHDDGTPLLTGAYVEIHDKDRGDKPICARPSQVSRA